MRHSLIPALCALVALQLGCGGGGSTPATPGGTATTPLAMSPQVAGALATHSLLETTVGRFSFAIDPEALTATATPIAMRTVQANDDLYDLSIANFTKRDTIAVRAVERTATTLDITYDITHPFAAPTNLAGPATAANRADLGVAGRQPPGDRAQPCDAASRRKMGTDRPMRANLSGDPSLDASSWGNWTPHIFSAEPCIPRGEGGYSEVLCVLL